MAFDYDELEVNPFYMALQNKYVDLHERAQESCYLLSVPQTGSLNPKSINTDFVETHILRPSPYFKGQFLTTHSSNCKTLSISDNGQYLTTLQGFSEERTVKILGEELAYNKEYKQYKILILERPLDPKFELKGPQQENEKEKQLLTPKIAIKECKDFLYRFPEFREAITKLDKNIEYFCRHYMVLPDYLDDAVARLQDMSFDSIKEMMKKLKQPLAADPRVKEVISGAVESYLMEAVYQKVFPVIRKFLQKQDQTLLSKCQKLNKVKPEMIGVRKEFSCPLPLAVVELANLGSLHTPREKLACLKSSVDNITDGITVSMKEKSKAPYLAGIAFEDASDDPCITSDDLIPILVTVIAQAKCCHIHSDLFYMENFMWDSTDRDRDNLGYCLVSFKAAVQYMTTTDFSHLNEHTNTSAKEISIEDLMAATSVRDPATKDKVDHRSSDVPGQARHERQLNRISDILEQATQELGSQSRGTKKSGQIESIFPDRRMKPPPPDLIPQQDRDKAGSSQLGDFLSALQNDDFDQQFGKQT